MNSDIQIVAVWGGPNSGKTTTCAKLAAQLAAEGKDVLIILDDPFCPNLPVLTAPGKDARSLGALMAAQRITQQEILAYSRPVEGDPHICLLGYILGDYLFRYPSYNRTRAEELLMLCRHTVDVVLVDCDSRLSKSALSSVAMDMADKVIKLSECTRKSISASESAEGLLHEKGAAAASKQLSCYSNVMPWQDLTAFQTRTKTPHALPHCEELQRQMEQTSLFKTLTGKTGKLYQDALQRLLREVFEAPVSKGKPRAERRPHSDGLWAKLRKGLIRK